MVRRRNLKPDPKAAMSDLVRRLNDRAAALETRPHGVKDLGETGDAVWTDPETGTETSVRTLPALIDETAVAIDAAKKELEETRTDLEGAKGDLDAERAAREQALADAAAALAELEGKLDAGPSTADLDAIRTDLAAAREVAESATTAATEANTAAVAASQAALEAAGIAASKGRVIVSETEPTGADRTASNIWIRPVPDDPATEVQESAVTYVYLEASDEWQATTSSELAQAAQNALDAREAAQQAQQRADTAVSSAATAQAAAEAAQRTADTATLNAADAHNAAVAARERADMLAAAGENLLAVGDFETGTIDSIFSGAGTTAANRAAWSIVTGDAASGVRFARWTNGPGGTGGYLPEVPVTPGRTYRVSFAARYAPGQADRLNNAASFGWPMNWFDAGNSTVNSNWPALYYYPDLGAKLTDSWQTFTSDVTAGNVKSLRVRFVGNPQNHPAGLMVDFDAMRVVDVTEAVKAEQAAAAAQARADAAMTEAAAKATPAQVAAAEAAAKDAAAADATAKAAQAKADALAGAATDAASKAAAAQAAAEATAAADAKTKADKALADALAALETARGQITAEIQTSANGKNAITVSSSAPSSSKPGVVVGDTWWRVDSAGTIYGQWAWTGKAWAARTIRSEVIANLDVGKLVVTGSSRFTEAVVDRLFADVFAAHKITATELSIGAVGPDGELVANSVRGVHIQDGTVSANKIVIDGDPENPDEVGLVARIAQIMHLAVEHLVVTDGATIDSAVILKFASEMVTAGVIRTAETGQRVVLDQTGIVMYGVDPDGQEFELVRIGPSGDNLITAGETTISSDGVQAPSGEFGDLSVGGTSLPELLASLPRGIRAWGYLEQKSAFDSNTTGYARRAELQTSLEPGRLYRVYLSSHYLNTSASYARVIETIRYSFDRSPIYGTMEVNSGTYKGSEYRQYLNGGRDYLVPGQEFIVDTGAWDNERTFWAMFLIRPETSGSPVQVASGLEYPTILAVEDIGPSVPGYLKRWNDNNEGSVQDAAPVVQRYTKTYKSSAFYSYDSNNNQTSDPDVVQGLYAGGPARLRRRGGWLFPSFTNDLSGAKVEKVEMYIYLNHSYYTAGATVNPATHNGNIRDSLSSFSSITGWKRNTGRWITLPSKLYDGFKNGSYKGVGVISTNSYAEQYARFNGSGAQIRITYVK